MHSQCVLFESCYTFQLLRAPAVASDRLSIESEGAINEELSAQHMLSCDTDGQDGCTGGQGGQSLVLPQEVWVSHIKFGCVATLRWTEPGTFSGSLDE